MGTRLEDIPDIESMDMNNFGSPPSQYGGRSFSNSSNYALNRDIPNLDSKIRGNPRVYDESGMGMYSGPQQPPRPPPQAQYKYREFSCREVSDHIEDCPICQKFYKQDNNVHLILIILLSVICVLLLKKVLDI